MADSLREALADAIENVEPLEAPAPVETPAPEPAPVTETAQQAADRVRDEGGRFAKTEKTSTAAGQPGKAVAAAPTGSASPPAVVEPVNAPASWKKEYWDQFRALPPDVQKYIGERESQFQSGVSTYKQEAERAKELWGAIAPFTEDLQRYNVNPAQWINQLGTVHQKLAKGTIEEKLATLQWVAKNYNIPIQSLQTGQIDPMTQQLHPLQETVRQLEGRLNSFHEQAQQQEQAQLQSEIQAFAASNPHYEAVRSQMAGLLQSGMADNLQSAYDKALRLNDELWSAEQQRLTTANAEKQRQDAATRVANARSKTVSVRSDTPGTMGGEGRKGLRANLEDVAESVLGGGRV